MALIVLACVVVAAMVSVLVVVLRDVGTDAGGRAQPTSGPRPAPTLDPSQRSDTEAAVRNGWTLADHDEFDGDELDEDLWSPYRGKTTDDVGQHDPETSASPTAPRSSPAAG